jgi:hypothetical protein
MPPIEGESMRALSRISQFLVTRRFSWDRTVDKGLKTRSIGLARSLR